VRLANEAIPENPSSIGSVIAEPLTYPNRVQKCLP